MEAFTATWLNQSSPLLSLILHQGWGRNEGVPPEWTTPLLLIFHCHTALCMHVSLPQHIPASPLAIVFFFCVFSLLWNLWLYILSISQSSAAVTGSSTFGKSAVSLIQASRCLHQCLLSLACGVLLKRSWLHQNWLFQLCWNYLNTAKGPGMNLFKSCFYVFNTNCCLKI